jgi:hypothetical protein
MRETTDTNDNFPDRDIPDGTYSFRIESVAKRYGGVNKDKPFYSWKLEYEGVKGEQVLMPNKMGELLRVLGCTETEKGKFDWDTDMVSGQYFDATVTHELDKKGVNRQQMSNFKKSAIDDDVPFGK